MGSDGSATNPRLSRCARLHCPRGSGAKIGAEGAGAAFPSNLCSTGTGPVGAFRTAILLLPGLLFCCAAFAEDPPRMTLNDCVTYALEHSPEIRKLDIEHRNQMLQTLVERGAFALDVGAGADYAADDRDAGTSLSVSKQFSHGVALSSTLTTSEDRDSDGDSASFSVKLSKKILGGGTRLETMLELDESLVNETIALNKLSRKRRQVVYQVRQAFYQLLQDIQSTSIQQRRLDRAKRNLAHAIEREKPLDIITAEIQVPENELALVQAQRAVKTGMDSLKVLMGMPVDTRIALVEDLDFQLMETVLAADSEYAENNHEDFLNNRLEIGKLERRKEVARAQLWPDLSLSATHQTQNAGDNVNLEGDHEQIVALELSWELGRATDRANYGKAKNAIRSKEIDGFILKQSKQQRLSELGQRLEENATSIRLQEQRIKLVTRQVELYADRWENGEIDILEFIRSQNDLENNKVELITLQSDYMQLAAEYTFEVGR